MGKVVVGSQNSKKPQLLAGSRGGLSVNISILGAQGPIFCSCKYDLSRDAVLLPVLGYFVRFSFFHLLHLFDPLTLSKTERRLEEKGGDIFCRLLPADEGR